MVRIWKNVTKKTDLGEKSLFEISVKKLEFIGDSGCHWPPAAFFPEIDISGFFGHAFF